jgi:3-phosphoshikimate 1-carboxyvinyltransferase
MFVCTPPLARAREYPEWRFHTPSSKPETQRALVLAALAPGRSHIRHDLRCTETMAMRHAIAEFGARSAEEHEVLVVDGVNLRQQAASVGIVDAAGSGLVARLSIALALVKPGGLVVTGDDILRRRAMSDLIEELNRLNSGRVRSLVAPNSLPVLVQGGALAGGRYQLPGDVTSQFVTALLVAGPLAQAPIEINLTPPVLSSSYLRQTIAAMARAGVQVEYSSDFTTFRIAPAEYTSFTTTLAGDFTSASYFLATAALFVGKTRIANLQPESLQGEAAMLRIVRELGVDVAFDEIGNELVVSNQLEVLAGNYEFDVSDCPNIVPTLAALGSFVEGRFAVSGASIVRLHKSSRVEAMAHALRAVGVDITLRWRGDVIDGFEIRGRHTYPGGAVMSSVRDHRIFMALFVASLRMQQPNFIDGCEEVECSFPGFLDQFKANGAFASIVETPTSLQSLQDPSGQIQGAVGAP